MAGQKESKGITDMNGKVIGFEVRKGEPNWEAKFAENYASSLGEREMESWKADGSPFPLWYGSEEDAMHSSMTPRYTMLFANVFYEWV